VEWRDVQISFCTVDFWFYDTFLCNTEVYGFKNHPECGKLKNRQIQMQQAKTVGGLLQNTLDPTALPLRK
jgi:hypothetical protein